jgi:peptidoglycan/LPS O-acetylase OafA/YrhL
VRATLNDELMHEAGFEVSSYEARERRRRRLRRAATFVGFAAAAAIVAGIEFVHANARLGAGSMVAMVIGVVLFLRAVLKADDEEPKS